jgi:hypothetical protein
MTVQQTTSYAVTASASKKGTVFFLQSADTIGTTARRQKR